MYPLPPHFISFFFCKYNVIEDKLHQKFIQLLSIYFLPGGNVPAPSFHFLALSTKVLKSMTNYNQIFTQYILYYIVFNWLIYAVPAPSCNEIQDKDTKYLHNSYLSTTYTHWKNEEWVANVFFLFGDKRTINSPATVIFSVSHVVSTVSFRCEGRKETTVWFVVRNGWTNQANNLTLDSWTRHQEVTGYGYPRLSWGRTHTLYCGVRHVTLVQRDVKVHPKFCIQLGPWLHHRV